MVLGLSIILIITSLVMVLLVLLHKGKGGGLSDLFGGGVSSTLGSSSVVERNLDRITIFTGALWFLCIVGRRLLLNRWRGVALRPTISSRTPGFQRVMRQGVSSE